MKARIISVWLALLIMLGGCALLQQPGWKPFQDMTPKEKSVFFIKAYNTQFDDYQYQSSLPDLSEDQIKVLRVKRDLLTKAYGLISVYNTIVTSNGLPTPEQEANLYKMINDLALMVI